jgi:hypothetical protein
MLILAHILRAGYDAEVPIRLATIVRDPEQVEATQERLNQAAQVLRIEVETTVILNEDDRDIPDLLTEESKSAALVMMGMARVDDDNVRTYIQRLRQTTSELESTLLVLSNIPDVEFE